MSAPLPVSLDASRSRGLSGAGLFLRPVRRDDGDALQTYVRGMSLRSRTNRFFGPLRELPPTELARAIGANNKDRLTLLLVTQSAEIETIIGEARVALSCAEREGEFGLSLGDDFRGRGLGSMLLGLIEDRAASDGIEMLFGDTLVTNESMIGLARARGYRLSQGMEARTVRMTKRLARVAPDLPCHKWADPSLVS